MDRLQCRTRIRCHQLRFFGKFRSRTGGRIDRFYQRTTADSNGCGFNRIGTRCFRRRVETAQGASNAGGICKTKAIGDPGFGAGIATGLRTELRRNVARIGDSHAGRSRFTHASAHSALAEDSRLEFQRAQEKQSVQSDF